MRRNSFALRRRAVPWTHAACYYAAAWLVADENEFLYAALMTEFESMLGRLKGRVCATYAPSPDAYGNWGRDG